MNLEYGTKLAVFQEILFAKFMSGAKINDEDQVRLFNNKYVSIAAKIAPNNLVIKHLCLRQLILKEDLNNKIIALIKRLSYTENNNPKLWAEGYSYWVYIKSFLMELQNVDIYDLIDIIDTNFQRTSYIRDDMLYPAPYADIWDTPLEKSLQDIKKVRTDSVCFPVTKQTFYGSDVPPEFKKIRPQNITVIYSITGAPIGLNNHIQLKDAKYYIDETGYPSNFKFYTGYQHKYPSRWKEFKDIFSWRRINGLW